jgi:hypothetical protein
VCGTRAKRAVRAPDRHERFALHATSAYTVTIVMDAMTVSPFGRLSAGPVSPRPDLSPSLFLLIL